MKYLFPGTMIILGAAFTWAAWFMASLPRTWTTTLICACLWFTAAGAMAMAAQALDREGLEEPQMNPADLFRRQPSEVAWLESAVKALQSPRHLRERNLFQLLLAERYQRQFGGTKLAALQKIAPVYATNFPH